MGILTSLLSGGLTGLLGTALTAFITYKEKQQDRAHELHMADKDRELMQAEADGAFKVATLETDAAKDIADGKAFAASYGHDRATYIKGEGNTFTIIMFTIIDTLRGSVRPILTYYLAIIVTALAFKVWNNCDDLSPAESKALFDQIIQTILYVFTTCVLWWFGTRNRKASK